MILLPVVNKRSVVNIKLKRMLEIITSSLVNSFQVFEYKFYITDLIISR